MAPARIIETIAAGVGAVVGLADKIADNADARIARKYQARMMRIAIRRERRKMRRESRKKTFTPESK
jgi:Cdc6-like AAA superfamily ATPase